MDRIDRLHCADLYFAHLQGAELSFAQLQGANLTEAQLQEANLYKAKLQGIISQSDSYLFFEQRIKDRIGEESELIGVRFEGSVIKEELDSLVTCLSADAAQELRAKFNQHTDKLASHELPKDSGAITGSYTKEEAEQWIAEYNEPTSAVSEDEDR